MIKVVSYNMHKGVGLDRRRDPRRILDVLCEIDGDVIALQEADLRHGTRAAIIPHRLIEEHSPWRAVRLHDRLSMGWHGNALLVRKDCTVLRPTQLHIPTLEPRGAICVDLTVDSKPIRVLGMHLDLSGLWRRRQARAILTHVEDCAPPMPTVMMGDLNEWTPNGGCLHDFRHSFDIAPTGPSFHARRAIGRLDRIMTRGFRVEACGVHTSPLARKASDHLPIWALIEPQ